MTLQRFILCLVVAALLMGIPFSVALADRLEEGIWLYEESENFRHTHYLFRGEKGENKDYEYYLLLAGTQRENSAWGHGLVVGDYFIIFDGRTHYIILKIINNRLCEGERITIYGTVRAKISFRRID